MACLTRVSGWERPANDHDNTSASASACARGFSGRLVIAPASAEMAEVAVTRPRRRRPAIDWLVVLGGTIMLIVLGLTIAAPVLAPFNPAEQRARDRLQGPSRLHPMGTDRLGRDIYSRVLYGGQTSLAASSIALVVTVTIGVALGLLAGYAGGWVDNTIMRIVDVLLAFPSFILALIVAGLYGPGLFKVVLAPPPYGGSATPVSRAAWCCKQSRNRTCSRRVRLGHRR